MSAILLQCVGNCFHRRRMRAGMHCLGAVTGGIPSPNGVGGRGGILSVFRALGVLVCEGRIQGPPRGYKEGPHCAAPMQAPTNDHVCEEDNYLCDRYLVLVREIADRTAVGSFLCIEVVLCSDCPCGLTKAATKNPICTVPSLSISPWQHASEMLLEYWCVCAVPSNPETMNFYGLYQAVRSRLHFSQVAAWWSRSNGAEPSYIATRVVPYNEENLRKFRETPVEHTFPLAGNGDGNSIKVTVWALPRMEEVPILTCPLHPIKEKDEESVARALTPTKAIPVPSASQNTEALVLPVLVDDRLQTPCNKPGKHHCRCEEEDGSPPSPSIPRPNGERKRRRSLPCGPSDGNTNVTVQPMALPSVQESTVHESKESQSSSYPKCTAEISNNRAAKPAQSQPCKLEENGVRNRNNLNSDNLERCFKAQLSIEEREGNVEKRYKRTIEDTELVGQMKPSGGVATVKEKQCNLEKDAQSGSKRTKDTESSKPTEKNGLFENLIPFNSSLPWSFVESWNNSTANGKCTFQSLRGNKDGYLNDPERNCKPSVTKDTSLAINPFRQPSPFHESNPGPSTNNRLKQESLNSACIVHQSCAKPTNKLTGIGGVSPGLEALESSGMDAAANNRARPGSKDLSQLMSKLSFPEDKEKPKEEGGFLEWFSKVPGRVLGVAPNNGYVENKVKSTNLKSQEQHGNEVKFKNCNLELSQREFDEVLAVLRARTPSGRKRTSVKTSRRRERSEKSVEEPTDRKYVNLENSECSTNNIVNRGKFCEGCSHKLCRKNDQQALEKANFNEIYGNKNIYDPSRKREKLDGGGSSDDLQAIKCNNAEKRGNEPMVCLQNVSNKADILLGAILRTSKERRNHTEVSSGTKPRSVLPASVGETETNDCEKTATEQRTTIVPLEDEKSLHVALNKRFNRFRQLFKKEQEKRAGTNSEDVLQDGVTGHQQQQQPVQRSFSYNNVVQPSPNDPKNSRDSKAKRRIDFSNFVADTEKREASTDTSELSTNGAHQNSRTYSTNHKEEGTSRGYDNPETAKWPNRLHSTNEVVGATKHDDEDDDEEDQEEDEETVTKILAKDPTINLGGKGNGYASVKPRSNGYVKDNTVTEEDETLDKMVPTAIEQERFRRSLENAASMVFHSRTGLPLTSSPAPLRRGSCCFDYDSTLNSVSSKRSALFELNTPPSPGAVSLEETDRETENVGEGEETPKRRSTSRSRPQSHALLGSFEESALNGRLEPVSTVHGFTAELGASGSFCPKHRKLPVTVFFYTLGDNDKVSTPYLAHINLGKKGYQVPRSGTIQVTLLNPLGTVVKMFVVLYDLSDMPPRSHTFLRQRTLRDKTLRYLVHLRFMSGKSGRIYLHTDIRMIICRKSDVDTASDFGSEPPKELRSYIHGPTNPKFSPRC
ncbi:atos homolog atossa isoform X2 [Ptiloglossa arizonensis]|uniref:atos homolog atossa isoform X2 n=1 Tax=Ptiloglossa arizonensis TaxID=3350558 RepID=UPI003FA1038F